MYIYYVTILELCFYNRLLPEPIFIFLSWFWWR